MRKKATVFPELEKQILIKNITKKKLAETLDITPVCFSRKLTGRVDFTLREVKILHEMFPNVSVEQLFDL